MSELVAPLVDAPPLRRVGRPSLEYGAQPAAGAAFVQAVTSEYLIRLVSVFVRLVTDGNAANRELTLEYRDAADQRFALAGLATTQAASITRDYFYDASLETAVAAVDSTNLIPLPPIILEPTWDWRLNVVNVQAGDQLSRIRYVVERFTSQ